MHKLHSTYDRNYDYLLDTVSFSGKGQQRHIVLPFVVSDFLIENLYTKRV